MKQVWITQPGSPEVLKIRQAPDPVPGVGEVRIRVEACGVSFRDVFGRMGFDRYAPRGPYVPGFEVSGTIDAVGQGVPDRKEGEPVFAYTRFGGGYSSVVCVPYRQVFRRWEWMTAVQGAAIPLNYLLAYQMLVVMGSVHPGDNVLIHNVGGGVGLAALDICKIVGAVTYGTASPQKHAFLRERGLVYAIDYRNHDYERVINDLTGQRGVQVILDPFGGQHWLKNYRLLQPAGRLVQFGLHSLVTGKKRSLLNLLLTYIRVPFYTPFSLMADNRAIVGVNWTTLGVQGDLQQKWMRQILTWYDEALFRPHIDRTFRLEQASEAHLYLQERKNIGKLVLVPE